MSNVSFYNKIISRCFDDLKHIYGVDIYPKNKSINNMFVREDRYNLVYSTNVGYLFISSSFNPVDNITRLCVSSQREGFFIRQIVKNDNIVKFKSPHEKSDNVINVYFEFYYEYNSSNIRIFELNINFDYGNGKILRYVLYGEGNKGVMSYNIFHMYIENDSKRYYNHKGLVGIKYDYDMFSKKPFGPIRPSPFLIERDMKHNCKIWDWVYRNNVLLDFYGNIVNENDYMAFCMMFVED